MEEDIFEVEQSLTESSVSIDAIDSSSSIMYSNSSHSSAIYESENLDKQQRAAHDIDSKDLLPPIRRKQAPQNELLFDQFHIDLEECSYGDESIESESQKVVAN